MKTKMVRDRRYFHLLTDHSSKALGSKGSSRSLDVSLKEKSGRGGNGGGGDGDDDGGSP